MADAYLDVISFRSRGDGGKAYAHKIGSAKKNEKGGMNVYLDSLPIPDKDGRVSLLISPRQEREAGAKPAARGRSVPVEEDDQIPF